jgi:hypothetical protein
MLELSHEKKPCLLISIRFLVAILGFMLTGIQYMQRINLSVAIVNKILLLNYAQNHEMTKILKTFTKGLHGESDSFTNSALHRIAQPNRTNRY